MKSEKSLEIRLSQSSTPRIISYPTGGLPTELRPGLPGREWMDNTPDGYAYRCLPLTVANSIGWEVINPSDFECMWTGGSDVDAVRIHADEPSIAMSHFGSGILTLQINALIRSEPGTSLMVTGPINRPKDAIFALSGIVETDWSPYTFTMNWKLTRTNTPVRFAAGEPIATLIPIQLAALESLAAETRHMAEDGPLHQHNIAWSNSRSTFNSELNVDNSEARKQKWQKSYHRGLLPDGTATPHEHRTKIRMAAFKPTSAGDP